MNLINDNSNVNNQQSQFLSLKILLFIVLVFAIGFFIFKAMNKDSLGNKAGVAIPPSSVINYYKPLKPTLNNDQDVMKLQQFLKDQGFYNGPIDGNFLTNSPLQDAGASYRSSIGINPGTGPNRGIWDKMSWTLSSGASVPNTLVSNSTCVTDFNNDGYVNIDDYILLHNSNSSQVSSGSFYDLNQDGIVDVKDEVIFMKNFGKQNFCNFPGSGAPEGTIVDAPIASPNPEGSDWASYFTYDDGIEWINDYRITTTKMYQKKKAPGKNFWVSQTVVTSTSTPGILSKSAVLLSKNQNNGIPKLISLNGDLIVVTKKNYTIPNGTQYDEVYHHKLVPKISGMMGNFDLSFQKIGNTLINKTYVDRKLIGSYSSNDLPTFSLIPPANGTAVQNPSVKLAIYDNGDDLNASVGYDFPSFNDPRLASFNLVQGSTASYDPETNTITADMINKDPLVRIFYTYNPNTQYVFNPGTLWTNQNVVGKGTHLSCTVHLKDGSLEFCDY